MNVLNAVYKLDFMGFSYGFRPDREWHDALDADVRMFFDSLSHARMEWVKWNG